MATQFKMLGLCSENLILSTNDSKTVAMRTDVVGDEIKMIGEYNEIH